jgi:4-amino-4-deoxy-L-arabinose transferase-like glycosyltransferase
VTKENLQTVGHIFWGKIESVSGWKYLLFVEGIYLLVSLSLFFSWPLPWPDEVEFADAARTLSEKGYLGTALIKGMESHLYWQPPLYFIVLATVIKLAGFNLAAVRIFSVAVGCLVIAATYVCGLKIAKNSMAPKLGVLLLALNPNFANYVKLARMDGLCVLFTLIALILYLGVIDHPSGKKYLSVGILLALAVLSHPLGFIGILAILIREFSEGNTAREKMRKAGLLLLPVSVALGLWCVYVLDDPSNFVLQMSSQFLRKALSPQLSFAYFLERYSSIPFFLLTLFVSVMYLVWLKSKEKSKRYLFLTILLLVSFITIGITFELPYHVYFLPYGSLAIAVLLVDGWRSSVRIFSLLSRFAIAIVLVNFLLYFGYFNYVFHFRLSREVNYEELVTNVESYIPSHSTVYLFGYPSLFWGLRKSPKQFSFVESVFLNDAMGSMIIRQIDYVVMSRGLNPEDDKPELNHHRSLLEDLCSKNGRTMQAVATVGVKKKFAYSAEIYSVGLSSAP